MSTAAIAYTDPSGNSDETLDKFKPSIVLAEPKDVGNYIDTQKYPEKLDFLPFFIGVSGGFDTAQITLERSGIDKSNLSIIGGNGTLSLGYSWKVDLFYIGLAADGSFNFGKSEYSNASGLKRTIEIPYSFGAYVIPGVFVSNNTVLYLKLGGVYSELKATYNNSAAFQANSISEGIWGGRAGLGVRYYFNKYFSINAEYVFSYYENVKDTYNDTTSKYQPLTNQFNIGLGVHF